MSYDEKKILREAKEVEYATSLNDRDAIVAVAAKHGLDDGEIGSIVGRSATSVERIRERLMEKRMRMEDQAQRTIEMLEGV